MKQVKRNKRIKWKKSKYRDGYLRANRDLSFSMFLSTRTKSELISLIGIKRAKLFLSKNDLAFIDRKQKLTLEQIKNKAIERYLNDNHSKLVSLGCEFKLIDELENKDV